MFLETLIEILDEASDAFDQWEKEGWDHLNKTKKGLVIKSIAILNIILILSVIFVFSDSIILRLIGAAFIGLRVFSVISAKIKK